MAKKRGIFLLGTSDFDRIYGWETYRDIAELVDVYAPPQTRESIAASPHLLEPAEIIFTGWNGPFMDDGFLRLSPNLRAVFHGAGSLASIITEAVWDRDIVVTTSIAANAIPVAEYTLATILFSLKHGWRLARETRRRRAYDGTERDAAPGCFGTRVGLISVGHVARRLIKLLRPFDVTVLAYDPYLSAKDAQMLGVQLLSLADLFAASDVVSLHTPHLPETEGMIDGRLLESMKWGATFINTARGGLVNHADLIHVAQDRPDLQFILDVAHPEPPESSSPLYTLENVVFTPHIAGSAGEECRRLGQYVFQELRRYLSGRRLKWAVTSDSIRNSSHIPSWTVPSSKKHVTSQRSERAVRQEVRPEASVAL